jgi:hypothetical protein
LFNISYGFNLFRQKVSGLVITKGLKMNVESEEREKDQHNRETKAARPESLTRS